ncbi:MAG: ATP-dependent helicase [Bacteroidia bacterium]|nr:ATP-dependent helicase [Bacteroidia bacterium]MCF8426217.1 ATP-dependent helicase [Bacteroidia bacterium]MCF8446241.1 ATP-dependent helicase [Bacteroidia bacterium]
MIVVNTQPFALIYALFHHPYLGLVLEPHVVQVNTKGAYTLTHQRVFTKTADYFAKNISAEDLKLIKILDEVDDDYIFKKFNTDVKRKIRTAEFFSKYCPKELLEEKIRPFIEERMHKVFLALRGKTIYKNGNDNNPTSVKITVADEQANIWFHFKNNPEGIRYYPTLRYKNQKVEFMYRGAQIVSQSTAWLLVENMLYDFEKNVDGKKLLPFMSKRYIQIPKKSEETYLSKFVIQLVEKYDVKSDCFIIQNQPSFGRAVLNMQKLFEDEVALKLEFNYGEIIFDYQSEQEVHAQLLKAGDKYVFNRVARNRRWEEAKAKELMQMGLLNEKGAFFTLPAVNIVKKQEDFLGIGSSNKYVFLEWLNQYSEELKAQEIDVLQDSSHSKYFIGPRELKIEVKEQKDWFDVQAIARFGDYSFSFLALREYIIKGKREFILPNGLIAIIPEEWFGNLSGILEFSANEDDIKIEKHHIGLLEELSHGGRYLMISDKLKKLTDYGQLRDMEMPQNFKGELRPYQKAGFDWFYFLKDNQFGGCLADDMGLGKTIQTLALIQKERELYLEQIKSKKEVRVPSEPIALHSSIGDVKGQLNIFDHGVQATPSQNRLLYEQTGGIAHHSFSKPAADANLPKQNFIRPSLIIVPNSLVFNWFNESKKFTPGIKILVYTGINRIKNAQYFINYDLIITTYGTVRVDIDVFKEFKFNYIILDESQAIKNAQSQVSKAVKLLRGNNKLVLTGTPIENSVQELWSQLSFVNPGLLGSLQSFTERFVLPIERQKDVLKMQQLKAIISPFILRRTKDQVATDLPPKMEQIVYCEMSEEQEESYEKVKSYYRNEIIKAIKDLGVNRSQFTLLQGLTKLRQIANHPKLVNPDFEGESGKFKEVTYMAETAMAEGHKVLVFSQFVMQLEIYRKWMESQKIDYCYLDGSMTNEARQQMVNKFQEGNTPFFLISLKAGGFGLNLTSADYVFMIDPWWNPAVERQAIDRAHRIGQKQNVFIYKFITRNSVEEKILALQEKKKLLADNIIETDESIIKHIDVDEIMDLLN